MLAGLAGASSSDSLALPRQACCNYMEAVFDESDNKLLKCNMWLLDRNTIDSLIQLDCCVTPMHALTNIKQHSCHS